MHPHHGRWILLLPIKGARALSPLEEKPARAASPLLKNLIYRSEDSIYGTELNLAVVALWSLFGLTMDATLFG